MLKVPKDSRNNGGVAGRNRHFSARIFDVQSGTILLQQPDLLRLSPDLAGFHFKSIHCFVSITLPEVYLALAGSKWST